jgi:hypothetical protein
VCCIVHKTTSKLERAILTTIYLASGKNTDKNYARGRVNHVAVEEAQEAPDVVLGMFFVNVTFAVVLFDSRASYSFISAAYVDKHNLPIALLKCQMIVSSLGGDMPTRQLCPKMNLKIRG